MPTSKKRLNISLSDNDVQMLAYLAKRDNVPQATKALHLIQMAIEMDEDDVWNAIASERDENSVSFVLHEDAWK
ncbi:MAG: hypothetical protein WCX61_02940 [Candidatus Peribacteraceae bacterium]|jgi:hypothetical protein